MQELTDRQKEVLALIDGRPDKEIAANLGISIRTVKAHIAVLKKKLAVDKKWKLIALRGQYLDKKEE